MNFPRNSANHLQGLLTALSISTLWGRSRKSRHPPQSPRSSVDWQAQCPGGRTRDPSPAADPGAGGGNPSPLLGGPGGRGILPRSLAPHASRLAAPAGQVWTRTAEGHFQPACQLNPGGIDLTEREEGRDELLHRAIQHARPVYQPPQEPREHSDPAPAKGSALLVARSCSRLRGGRPAGNLAGGCPRSASHARCLPVPGAR